MLECRFEAAFGKKRLIVSSLDDNTSFVWRVLVSVIFLQSSSLCRSFVSQSTVYHNAGDIGVQHIRLTGDFQGEAVVLHAFTKCFRHEDKLYYRIAVTFQGVLEPIWSNARFKNHFTQAGTVLQSGSTPQISISSSHERQNITLEPGWYDEASMLHNTGHFQLPEGSDFGDDANLLLFEVLGWELYDTICCSSRCRRTPYHLQNLSETNPGVPPVYITLTSFYGIPTHLAGLFLKHHMAYHMDILHANGTVLYARTKYFLNLQYHPQLSSYLDSGRLTLVYWRELPALAGKPYADQAMAQEHLLIAHWNEDVYLVMVDADEFIASPKPTTFPSLVRDCFQSAAMAHMVYYPIASTANGTEVDVWKQESASHPLASYTLRSHHSHNDRITGRSAVRPGYVFGNFVHQVRVSPNGHMVHVGPECAFVAHAVNRLIHRHGREEFGEYTDWLWF